jgi:hypothetical protein
MTTHKFFMTPEDIARAYDVCDRITAQKKNGMQRYGCTVIGRATELAGVVGELMVSKWLHLRWNIFDEHPAADVGDDIQVRSTDNPKGGLFVHDPVVNGYKGDDPNHPFVLVTVGVMKTVDRLDGPQGFALTGEAAVMGWTWGWEAQVLRYKEYAVKKLGPGERSDHTFLVPQRDLKPPDLLEYMVQMQQKHPAKTAY